MFLHYSQADIKAQIKAAKLTDNGKGSFSSARTIYGQIVKKIEGEIDTNKDVKSDIYPHIKVRYETDTEFKTIFYSLSEIKELVKDLNLFQETT
jgi:hypothetical protein